MDYLLDKDFSKEDIDSIMNELDEDDISLLILNQDNVCNVIDYLKKNGFTNILKILLEKNELFLMTPRYLDEVLSKYDKEKIKDILMYDIDLFDRID